MARQRAVTYARITHWAHGTGPAYVVYLYSSRTSPPFAARHIGNAHTQSGAEELARKHGAESVHMDYATGSERRRVAPHPRTRAERLVIQKELARRRAAAKKQARNTLGLFQ